MFINVPSQYDVFSACVCLKPTKSLIIHFGEYIHYKWKSCFGVVHRSKRRQFCIRIRKETHSEKVSVTGVYFEAQGDKPPRGTILFTEKVDERPRDVVIDGYMKRFPRM